MSLSLALALRNQTLDAGLWALPMRFRPWAASFSKNEYSEETVQSISRKYLVTAFALAIAALVSVSAFGAAADGAATFKAKCAMCHGQDATGNTPMGKNLKIRDLTSADVQKQSDAEI